MLKGQCQKLDKSQMSETIDVPAGCLTVPVIKII